jgi:enamine deaminase RidA (YjgF/YER057c/UK114 family)
MLIENKIKELGLNLPVQPSPVANYLTARASGNLLYLSGTTCYTDEGLMFTGKLGQELTVGQGYLAARQTALNLLSVAKGFLGDLDKVTKIIKLNGYVNCIDSFTEQPRVINGASDLLVAVFGEQGKHARTSIGVNTLPGNIPVEIELILEIEIRIG